MDKLEGNEVVRLARQLERLMARRRKAQKLVDALDAEISTTRKFLRELVVPSPLAVAGEPLPGEDRP